MAKYTYILADLMSGTIKEAVTVRCVWRQSHTVAVSFRAVDIGPIPT